jgi:hypothetical protein
MREFFAVIGFISLALLGAWGMSSCERKYFPEKTLQQRVKEAEDECRELGATGYSFQTGCIFSIPKKSSGDKK